MIKKIDFPTDTDHISLPNSAEKIKQQKINEEEIFLKTELKKNERDMKTLENLIDETKRDLLRSFTEPDSDVVVHDIINVNDWRNKTKNKLDLDIQQDYKESASEMIKANNADLLQQMITNNENEELLFSQKVNEQKKCKNEELAEKIQSSLDLFLRNYDNSEDDKIKADFEQRKSKRLIELRKKYKKPYQFNLHGKTKVKIKVTIFLKNLSKMRKVYFMH